MPNTMLQRKTKVVQIIPPADHTTSTDGSNIAVDTLGFNEAILCVDLGLVDDVLLSIDIQQSDEAAANFATLPAPVVTTINPRLLTFVNADDNIQGVAYLDLTKLKRYIKPIDTLNANSALYGVSIVMFGPEEGPTDQTFEVDAT